MNRSSPQTESGPESLPLSAATRVNAVCEQFEAAWRAGAQPRIEDHLPRIPAADSPALLRELVALEVELRRNRGERPDPVEYRDRFPAADDQIAAAFDAAAPPAGDDTIVYNGPRPVGSRASAFPAVGTRIGDYEVLDEIERGGMGVVFRARHIGLERQVALKMILSGPFASPAEVQRFLAEAKAAASLDHEQIVTIYEVGQHLGYPFFTMRLVEGGSLAAHRERFRDDPAAAARLVIQVAHAVDYAHQQGFVHRDLKPGNILIDARGIPHIIDFGLSKRVGANSGLTQVGATVGTPSYMAPEQAGGRDAEVTALADVYGLGAILYELLTGQPPFRAETVNEIVMQVLEQEPVPPRRLRPGVPRDLELICLKCLEKRPERRYASAAALADDLERHLRHEAVEAGRLDPLGRFRRWTRRHPDLAARLLGLGAILLFTQINYLIDPRLEPALHWRVTITEALWFLSAPLLCWWERREGGSVRSRAVWLAVDIAFATATLRVLDAGTSPYVLGFALLIAATGLWSRTRLVWLATAFSIVGYALLAFPQPSQPNHHPDVIISLLVVTGYVVAQQVKRLNALSTFYENRLAP